MKDELTYTSLKHKIMLSALIGPLLLIAARISGADFMDGLAASPRSNTALQDNLITWGLWIPILASLAFSIACVYYVRKFDHKEKRFITKLLPLALLVPFPLAVFSFFILVLIPS